MQTVPRRARRTDPSVIRRPVGSALLGIAAVVLGGCAPLAVEPPLPLGFGTDVDRYWAAVHDVCVRGVTPEMRSLHETARQSVESTGYGAGTSSNFWGIRSPDSFYQDCFQSPGWE